MDEVKFSVGSNLGPKAMRKKLLCPFFEMERKKFETWRGERHDVQRFTNDEQTKKFTADMSRDGWNGRHITTSPQS